MSCTNNSLRSINASDLTSMKYYDYTIDYITEPNGKRMYLVSKIIDQYNKKYNMHKKLYTYFRSDIAQEFTEILAAEEGVATLRLIQNKKNNLNNSAPVYDYKNLPGISQLVSIKGSGSITKAYIVSEPLLNDCLMSIDRKLARDIINFIIKCRELDNEYLNKKLIGLQLKVKTLEDINNELKETNEMLSNRFIRDLEPNNWRLSIVPAFDKRTEIFELRLIYEKTNSKSLSLNALISVVGIPNANVMRTNMFPRLLKLLEPFQGKRKNKQRSRITMPLNSYALIPPKNITLEMLNSPVELIPIRQDLLFKIKDLIETMINSLDWQECFVVCYEN